jgi:hypothetical protein
MAGEESAAARTEAERELEHRRFIELLNELRVALTGVQILFAFLLTVPFTQRFSHVTAFQRDVYFATLLCAAAAVVLLIAPTAQHRMLFRRHHKHELILLGGTMTLVGLAFLALAMTGVILLITDILFRAATVIVVTTSVATAFVTLWYLMPLLQRLKDRPGEPHP